MADEYYTGTQYKLRSGSPMPTIQGHFVLHTFLAEEYRVDSYLCTETLPGSEEFRGQYGPLISASYSRLGVRGGNTFQGKKTYSPTFIEEDELNFNL